MLTIVDLCTKWTAFLPLKTKLPAEVLANLCNHWFHVHGLPAFILSDRGKEFLGVVSTVCKSLNIKHIKTTPYHPRTNGLCESQHKALTYELRISSDRKSAPEWCDLLTEISFSINITPSQSNAAISPFELVFGRKPRLSAVDICFPVSVIPTPPQSTRQRKLLLSRLRQKLQGLRFKALEHSIEYKETLRVAHDSKRANSNSALQLDDLQPGDVVCVYSPSPTFKKLTYQWTGPDHIVVSVKPNTCVVRRLSLTSGEEGAVSRVTRKTGKLPSKVINRKMLSSFPMPLSFFLGAKVMRKFGKKWFTGTIDDVSQDEGTVLWHVSYPDFDGEEFDRQQLGSHIICHPLLNAATDL